LALAFTSISAFFTGIDMISGKNVNTPNFDGLKWCLCFLILSVTYHIYSLFRFSRFYKEFVKTY
jgi:hypothetical protein